MRVPKIRPLNRGTSRKPNYWACYYVDGEEIREPTAARSKQAFKSFVEQLERQFRLGTWKHPRSRPTHGDTFAAYAPQVIARRIARGVKGAAKDEHGHVHNHLIPMFGDRKMVDLESFKLIRDEFRALEERGELAGRTIRNVHSTLRAILFEAADDEKILHVPPPLTAARGHLPSPIDKDPAWRQTAVFTRDEIAKLLLCEDIPPQFRTMYAVYFMAGCRARELLPVKVRDYERHMKPLPSLLLPASKTRRDKGQLFRVVPVHPDLKAWLDWWLDTGFELTHGTKPTPDGLMFPTMSKIRRGWGFESMSYGELYMRWRENHLPAAELRHRRLHDSRRTLLSVARSSGAPKDVSRALTHKTTGDRILDAYTTWEWEALCKAVMAIAWGAPLPPGQQADVINIERARR